MPSARDPQPELTRQAGRFRKPASWFLLIAAALELPGIVLFLLGSSWVAALGLALIGVGGPFLLVGAALAASAVVAGWAGHRRPFA